MFTDYNEMWLSWRPVQTALGRRWLCFVNRTTSYNFSGGSDWLIYKYSDLPPPTGDYVSNAPHGCHHESKDRSLFDI